MTWTVEQENFMRAALTEAELAAQAGEVPVGAIAVQAGQIIAAAHNEIEQKHDGSAHAELLLLQKCAQIIGDWRLEQITIYVTKEPCAMCAGAMCNAHLGKVVFGLSDPRSGACGSTELNVIRYPGMLWHPECEGGCLSEECLAQFRGFFAKIRQQKKSQT